MADNDREEEDEKARAEALVAQLTVQPVWIAPVPFPPPRARTGVAGFFLEGCSGARAGIRGNVGLLRSAVLKEGRDLVVVRLGDPSVWTIG